MNEFTAAYVQGFQKGAASTHLSERPKPENLSGEDVVPMEGMGGALADVLLPYSHGGFRAGKSEVLGESVGAKVPGMVKRPGTSATLHALLGAGAGAGLGAGAGAGIAGLMDEDAAMGAAYGGIAGYTAGAILGSVVAGIRRRKAMQEINDQFDDAETVKPYARRGHPLALFAGSHELGRAEALKSMTKGVRPDNPGTNVFTSAGSLVHPAVGAVGSAVGKFQGRSKIRDLVAQEMGYAPSGFGVSNRMAPNRALAAAN